MSLPQSLSELSESLHLLHHSLPPALQHLKPCLSDPPVIIQEHLYPVLRHPQVEPQSPDGGSTDQPLRDVDQVQKVQRPLENPQCLVSYMTGNAREENQVCIWKHQLQMSEYI